MATGHAPPAQDIPPYTEKYPPRHREMGSANCFYPFGLRDKMKRDTRGQTPCDTNVQFFGVDTDIYEIDVLFALG